MSRAGLGWEPADLTEDNADRFLAVRRERGVSLRSWRAFGPLVAYLRGLGVIPDRTVAADTPVERLLADYRGYLLRERGLTAGSVAHWERIARLLLAERSESLEDAPRGLTVGDVTAFVVAQCGPGGRSGPTAKILTSGLRSLLRYLHLAGFTEISLAQAVPRVAGWRLAAEHAAAAVGGRAGRAAAGELRPGDGRRPARFRDPGSPPHGWDCEPGRSRGCVWTTSTGGPARSRSAGRDQRPSVSRYRTMLARRWWPTCETDAPRPPRSARCS